MADCPRREVSSLAGPFARKVGMYVAVEMASDAMELLAYSSHSPTRSTGKRSRILDFVNVTCLCRHYDAYVKYTGILSMTFAGYAGCLFCSVEFVLNFWGCETPPEQAAAPQRTARRSWSLQVGNVSADTMMSQGPGQGLEYANIQLYIVWLSQDTRDVLLEVLEARHLRSKPRRHNKHSQEIMELVNGKLKCLCRAL